MSKQQNNLTLARMKVNHSRVYPYFQLIHSLDGYIASNSFLPEWANNKLTWDHTISRWYWTLNRGKAWESRTPIPNGSYVVKVSEDGWPLIISSSGFEADWEPLTPEETENYLGQVFLTNTDSSLRDSLTRSKSTLATDSVFRSLIGLNMNESDDTRSKSRFLRGLESLAQHDETEASALGDGKAVPFDGLGKLPLKDERSYPAKEVVSESEPGLSGEGAASPDRAELDSVLFYIRNQKNYHNLSKIYLACIEEICSESFKAGAQHGKEQTIQSICEAIRQTGRVPTQLTESVLERASGEEEAFISQEELERLRKHGYEFDSGEKTDGIIVRVGRPYEPGKGD